MSKSLTERVTAMENKIAFWKGFLSGVISTLGAIVSVAGCVYAIVQTARLLGY